MRPRRRSSSWRRPWVWAIGEAVDPFGGGREQRRGGRLGRRGCEIPIARWVLPVPGGPRNTTLARSATKSRVPRCAITSRLSERWSSKSKSSRVLRAGNRAARMRPSPPWSWRAATSRSRHAARNSSWVQPRCGPVRRAVSTDRASDGAFNARHRYAMSVGRLGGRWPSRDSQCPVVVGEVAFFDRVRERGGDAAASARIARNTRA